MRRLIHAVFGLGLLTALAPSSAPGQKNEPATAQMPDNVELLRDIEFGTMGTRPLKLHILRPRKTPTGPMPVLVWIHGGSWQNGSKDSGIDRLAPYAKRGYFCACVEYRLSGEAIFPAQIEDCKCAIRFLRAKAKEYRLDPDRIGAWGESAGGHLAALLGTSDHVKELEGKGGHADHSSRVNAVCAFCGPTYLANGSSDRRKAEGPLVKLLGGDPAEKLELARLASPITHIRRDAPPFLLVHGDQDTIVPQVHANVFATALKEVGVPVTLHIAKGQGHALGGPEIERAVCAFFDRQFKVK